MTQSNKEYGETWRLPKDMMLVPLWWERHAFTHDGTLDSHLDTFKRRVEESVHGDHLVYVISGSRDSIRARHVLYIGRTGRQDLSARPMESVLHRVAYRDNGSRYFYADCWDVTVQWANVKPELAKSVEELLILAHSPPFNAQLVRKRATGSTARLILFNAGVKCMLHPTIVGYYFAEVWDDS